MGPWAERFSRAHGSNGGTSFLVDCSNQNGSTGTGTGSGTGPGTGTGAGTGTSTGTGTGRVPEQARALEPERARVGQGSQAAVNARPISASEWRSWSGWNMMHAEKWILVLASGLLGSTFHVPTGCFSKLANNVNPCGVILSTIRTNMTCCSNISRITTSIRLARYRVYAAARHSRLQRGLQGRPQGHRN